MKCSIPVRVHRSLALVAWIPLGLAFVGSAAAESIPKPEHELVFLETVDPGATTPGKDLRQLADWLGDARVVGLGENPHGVDAYHRLAHRIFRYLAEHEGFGVFALEIEQAHAQRLDDYVQGRRDDLEAILAEHWWVEKVFYDQALADLLRWMRQHNESGGRPVRFVGFDMKQPTFAFEELRAGLEAELRESATRIFQEIENLGGLGVFPNVSGFTGEWNLTLPPSENPRQLQAEAWAQGEGVDHGSTGIFFQAISPSAGRITRDAALPASEITGGQTHLTLDVELPADVAQISLRPYHRGNGTVWLTEPKLRLDGEIWETELDVADLEVWPLFLPKQQAMDYTHELDPHLRLEGLETMRIDCSPAVDRGLRAVAMLRKLSEMAGSAADASERARSRRLVRLIEQAVHWRTLVENNRDVFLAENLLWLAEERFPEQRILVLAHTSHTERIPNRMGQYLAETLGASYRTVSMRAAAGEYRYLSNFREAGPETPLEWIPINPARHGGPLAGSLLSASGGVDLLFHVAGSRGPEAWQVRSQDWPAPEVGPEILILLQEVGAR